MKNEDVGYGVWGGIVRGTRWGYRDRYRCRYRYRYGGELLYSYVKYNNMYNKR